MSPKKAPAHNLFKPTQRIEDDYRRAIQQHFLRLLNFSPSASVEEILSRLSRLSENTQFLTKWSSGIAHNMVSRTRVANAKSWREAARKNNRSREIYKFLSEELQGKVGTRVNQIVTENSKLIRSLPHEIKGMVANEIASMQQRGYSTESIAEYLHKRVPQLAKNKAALIARTESSKASTALSQARSEDLGIKAYVWSTSRDKRVRKSHRFMDGVIVFWNDPPSPEKLVGIKSTLGHYHGGAAPNCRCDCLPIVSLDELHFPVRVYRRGRIQYMTRKQFADVSGLQRFAA